MYSKYSDSSSTQTAGVIRRLTAGITSHAFAAIALTLFAVDVLAAGTGTTTVTLASSPNPSQPGQSVHLGAIVSESGSGTYETGTVTISESFDGDAPDVDVCPNLPLNGSSGVKTASCDLTIQNPGVHLYIAKYSGDTNYAPQNSTVVSQIVEGIALTINTPTTEYSQDVSIAAAVTGNNPTGTVIFSDVDSLQTVCTVTLSMTVADSKEIQCNSFTLTPGTHHIGAAYQGDGSNPGSVSNNGIVTVSKAVSHTSLTAPVSSSVAVGQNIHFVATLTVDQNVRLAPTGTVTFIDGGPEGTVHNVLCQATATQASPSSPTIMTASCDAAFSGPSHHVIGASFQPDSPYMALSGSNENVMLTVLANPVLTLSSSVSAPVVGQPVTLIATLSGAVNPTGTVELDDGRGVVATLPLTPSGSGYTASYTFRGAGAGPYQFFANYSGDGLNSGVSATPLTVTLGKADTRISSVVANPASIQLGGSTTVTITFNVLAPSDGGYFGSGVVNLSDGSANCAPITVPYSNTSTQAQLSCTLTPISAGAKTLTATFSGDNSYNASAGTGTLTVTNSSATTYTVTPSAGPNGSILPSTQVIVTAGATTTFTVTPASGYTANVSGCGGALTGNTYTTAPITSDCSVTARFSNASTANVNLNQFGLSGGWSNPAAGGQGIVLSMFPDYTGPGHGVAAGGWFTYDVAPSGGPEKQRWYSLQGPVDSVNRVATLNIYDGDGGNFDAPPKVLATQVGSATLQFSDCGHGTLTYTFTDGSGRSGSIPLSRLDSNVTCSLAGDGGSSAPAYQLSGAWYQPSTSGQGFFAVVNPVDQLLFAAWYTYMPNGAADGSSAQRWYTLQLGPGGYMPSTSAVAGIPIYTGTGGVFDNPAPYLITQVGTATLTFIDCGHAQIDYNFSEGTNAGLSGSIDLVKLGALPAQCGLTP